jgi:hypothetical protein
LLLLLLVVAVVVVAVVVVAAAHIGRREEAGGRIKTLHQKLKIYNSFTSPIHKLVSAAVCRNYASWTLAEASVEETCSAKWPENWWLLPAFQNRRDERRRKERGASK